MVRYLRLFARFFLVSIQEEMAYRSNFFIGLLQSLLNLVTGTLGVVILFSQVRVVHGWTFASSLGLLGAYLVLGALQGMFISPSLNALAGLDGEIWTGRFDFTLLCPLNAQFIASFRRWRLLPGVDLLLGSGLLGIAALQLHTTLSPLRLLTLIVTLCTDVVVLYAVLLLFAALLFWNPGFLFTWIFDGLFQMARYPVGLYPNWLRLVLTWVIPIGVMTTVPAEALSGELPTSMLIGSIFLALGLVASASMLFQVGLRRYSSASS